MLSDKKIKLDYKQNPGVMIGKDEMAKFIAFVKEISKENEVKDMKTKLV